METKTSQARPTRGLQLPGGLRIDLHQPLVQRRRADGLQKGACLGARRRLWWRDIREAVRQRAEIQAGAAA